MMDALFHNAGTRLQTESYKAGRKLTNIVLDILNLQRKEELTIDLVSNQDFSEVIYMLFSHLISSWTLQPEANLRIWSCEPTP
jgi:hypothetical protein